MSSEDRGNLLGALLRLAHSAMEADIYADLSRGGYGDLQPGHQTAMRPLWDVPEGARATELAVTARVTKQTMGATLEQLEDLGYVERYDDPDDRRAKLVRLTKRGRAAGKAMRVAVRKVESAWGKRIGAAKVEAVRGTLTELLASLEGAKHPAREVGTREPTT